MKKPKHIEGYDEDKADRCEQLLVTLLRGLGPWKDSVYLVGGLVPRYLVQQRPPNIPRHAGTMDVDVVIDLQVLISTKAYRTLSENLVNLKFEPLDAKQGLAWKWKRKTEGEELQVEFLTEHAKGEGGKPKSLPDDASVGALHIDHASMVYDYFAEREITADLLDEGGKTTETVRHANIVSFTCLKTFAFEDRAEPKDAHDLLYCLEHSDVSLDEVANQFRNALTGLHAAAVSKALHLLRKRFVSDENVEGHTKDGPVAVGKFENVHEGREKRMVRQRTASDIITQFLDRIGPLK